MTNQYDRMVDEHLEAVFSGPPSDLPMLIGATAAPEGMQFRAFGRDCRLSADGIRLDGTPASGVPALLIALYARHAIADAPVDLPLKAFSQLPDSAPYAAAFRSHTETPLIPHVTRILACKDTIQQQFDGRPAPAEIGGDWTLLLRPLPKIALCYAFYAADEEFPPAATCLFSSNADRFLPTDALADVAEYTSKALIEIGNHC